MNCAECRDNLVALSEKLLGAGDRQECLAHLETCPGCRAEYEAITCLQQRLVTRGQTAARAGIVAGVMRRVMEPPPERETIMTRLMKHRWSFGLSAAAGATVIAIAVMIVQSPKAFGLEQVLAAYNNIRTLHVKTWGGQSSGTNEYWIQCNDQGQPEKARYDLPKTEDGEKLITWTPEKAEIWFKTKHGFLIMQTKRIAPMMQSLLEGSQPQVVVKRLLEAQKAGKVDVQELEAQDAQNAGMLVVTHNDNPRKEIYYVARGTDLITRIEYYGPAGTNDVLKSWTEFSDYNAPLDAKMFELRDQLPPDVHIADQLSQVTGVAQGNLTDDAAAAETVRQFFQALVDQDYKTAGSIYGGEQEADFKAQFGSFRVSKVISVGPAVLQTNWDKRGYRVPCKLEVHPTGGEQYIAQPAPYVRPGDDEAHPDNWHITGGVSLSKETEVLPDNAKYAALTPEQTAQAFFEACSQKNWDEAAKFMPYLNDRLKEYLGGLKLVSVGQSFGPDEYPGGMAPKGYPGRYVPYEIQIAPQQFNVRVANTNAAKRCVLTGFYDSNMNLQQDFKWDGDPEILTNNDAYAAMSPHAVVQAYFNAQSKFDWTEMRKFTSAYDVEQTKKQAAEAEQLGLDMHKLMPAFVVGEAIWAPGQSAWFVKCQVSQTKKFYLAVRNDNAGHRWQVDGGI